MASADRGKVGSGFVVTPSAPKLTVKILEYTGLDTARVKASCRKVADAIARNDFRAAQEMCIRDRRVDGLPCSSFRDNALN